jgi:uncharacterized protein YndB with AHSA1/START domain
MDRIEKTIELSAPLARVWRAVADSREFCQWFRANLDGPFVAGATVRGHSTYPGHEDAKLELIVRAVDPPCYLAFEWAPWAEAGRDLYTLVEFRLEGSAAGTRLQVSESGFDRLPADRRESSYRDNDSGWTIQLNNIVGHVTNSSIG